MEVYERETAEVIRRFLARRISFPDCIAALDAALAGLIPHLTGEDIRRLGVVMLANNEIVMKEMERRGRLGVDSRQLKVAAKASRHRSPERFDNRLSLLRWAWILSFANTIRSTSHLHPKLFFNIRDPGRFGNKPSMPANMKLYFFVE